MGQFINYRIVLRTEDPKQILYLAVPSVTYNDFFSPSTPLRANGERSRTVSLPFTQTVVQETQILLLVYNIETEEILQWLS